MNPMEYSIAFTVIGVLIGAMGRKIQGGDSPLGTVSNVIIGLIGSWLVGMVVGLSFGAYIRSYAVSGNLHLISEHIEKFLIIGPTVGAIIGALGLVWIAGVIKRRKNA